MWEVLELYASKARLLGLEGRRPDDTIVPPRLEHLTIDAR